MLTLFATAKAFEGHSGIIQRNALKSWTLLHPDVEVILFGDDKGTAEIAAELGLRHEPYVERNELGTKRLDSMFGQAQKIARNDILCYVNCDIVILPSDGGPALGYRHHRATAFRRRAVGGADTQAGLRARSFAVGIFGGLFRVSAPAVSRDAGIVV